MIAPASTSNPRIDFILNAANWEKVLDAAQLRAQEPLRPAVLAIGHGRSDRRDIQSEAP
jgi:hypothetical protein